MKPPGLLVNVRAGGIRRDPRRLERLCSLVPPDHRQLTRTAEEIPSALAKLHDTGVEILAIVGGDGTSTWTLSALLRVWPPRALPAVLLLPGGTINTIPSSLGVRRRADRALDRFLRSESVRSSPRAVLRVLADDAEPRAALVFGNGVAARWLRRYNARTRRGPWIAAGEVARSIGSIAVGGRIAREILEPFEAEVRIDGGPPRVEKLTGMAAGAIRHIGLGFRPFLTIPPEGSTEHFHWISTSVGGLGLALELPAARLGMASPSEGLRHASARAVAVRCARPEPYTLDGDLFPPAAELRVELGPVLRFVTP